MFTKHHGICPQYELNFMQIQNLNIKGLYGYIDKNINFNGDLTILVGVNGSGKTSILNILNWILRPKIENLCVTEFKLITLTLTFKNVKYTILCTHNKTSFHYKLSADGTELNPLVVKLVRHPSKIGNDEKLQKELIEDYSGLKPDDKELETWEIISKFPKPTVIGLDRNLYAEESSEELFIDERLKGRFIRKKDVSSITPLERVNNIINTQYRKQKNAVLEQTNLLKNHLMLSTFDGSITRESFTTGIRYKLTIQQITNAEKRVNEYFEKFEETKFTQTELATIGSYFADLKAVIKQYQSDSEDNVNKLLYGLNANQFIKVRKLLKEFEGFDAKVSKLSRQIQSFLDTANFFLKDSSKELVFREETSELAFNTLDVKGNIVASYKEVSFLSSGEQQILILLSYLAFNSSDGKIFIIDEPELSLHIKWQECFLEKLDKITPPETQIILATHSPILANKKKNKAILLRPYNQ